MGYYDQTDLPFYYDLASQFAISDRYFCSLLGPTFPNREYLFAGTSFGRVSTTVDPNLGLAPNGAANLLRTMSAKGITWKEYKTDLSQGLLFPDFGTDPAQAAHFVDVSQFATDAAADQLPQVSIVDPSFVNNSWLESDEHPPADMQVGQHFVWEQLEALVKSPAWKTSVAFLTYDENGGLYDHVPPPKACVPDTTPPAEHPEIGGFDRLGFRVPVFVVSPYAKRHFVSHTVHSHTSILRFVEAKFDLPAFTARDANSDAMLDFFDFDHPDFTVPTFSEPPVSDAQIATCKVTFPGTQSL
jgi:phospholipase C